MTAYCLQNHVNVPYKATIFEASPRLGGKILTSRFDCAPATYEAGAAELYDYSEVGPDPLRELIAELGLATMPMDGCKVIMNHSHAANQEAGKDWDRPAIHALDEFDRRARACISPRDFYGSDWKESDGDPFGKESFHSVLAQIPVESVRRYVQTMVHSDLATEPDQTNAIYGLQNYLMNDPAYMQLYTIEGGIERLPQELASRIDAEVLLNRRVVRSGRQMLTGFRIVSRKAAIISKATSISSLSLCRIIYCRRSNGVERSCGCHEKAPRSPRLSRPLFAGHYPLSAPVLASPSE